MSNSKALTYEANMGTVGQSNMEQSELITSKNKGRVEALSDGKWETAAPLVA